MVKFWQRAVTLAQAEPVPLLVLLPCPLLLLLLLLLPGVSGLGIMLSRQALQTLLMVTLVELQTKRVELAK